MTSNATTQTAKYLVKSGRVHTVTCRRAYGKSDRVVNALTALAALEAGDLLAASCCKPKQTVMQAQVDAEVNAALDAQPTDSDAQAMEEAEAMVRNAGPALKAAAAKTVVARPSGKTRSGRTYYSTSPEATEDAPFGGVTVYATEDAAKAAKAPKAKKAAKADEPQKPGRKMTLAVGDQKVGLRYERPADGVGVWTFETGEHVVRLDAGVWTLDGVEVAAKRLTDAVAAAL